MPRPPSTGPRSKDDPDQYVIERGQRNRERAFRDAGIPDTMAGRRFRASYDGPLSYEAITAAWALIEPS